MNNMDGWQLADADSFDGKPVRKRENVNEKPKKDPVSASVSPVFSMKVN